MTPLDAFRTPERLPKSIQSSRIKLRQYRMDDAEEFSKLYAESFPGHLEPWSPPVKLDLTELNSRRAAREHLEAAIDFWEEGRDYRFFITRVDTGNILGQIGLTQVIRGVSQSCFIGYWIGKSFINHGYATEAVVLAMEYAFEHLKLHRVTLWIAIGNTPSLRIPKKLGLRYEGTAMTALFLGNTWRDTEIYAMTLEEWNERRDELKRSFAP